MAVHFVNKHLPPSERIDLDVDITESLLLLDQSVDVLEICANSSEPGPINPSALTNTFSNLSKHFRMKYEVNGFRRLRILNVMLQLYFTKTLSFAQKVGILDVATKILKKQAMLPSYQFKHWRILWDEAVSFVTRDGIGGSTSNAALLANLVNSIVAFLHSARNFIPAEDVPIIVDMAHTRLEDPRNLQSVEGLMLLMNCLPTNYDRYDDVLPHWISLWSRFSHSPVWDSCWLTLLCRSRKYTRFFDWSQLVPLFQVKARELMSLPAIQGQHPRGHSYPLDFPAMYSGLLPTRVNANSVGLNKLAKLMYGITLFAAPAVLVGASNLTPPKFFGMSASEIPQYPGFNSAAEIHPGAREVVYFIQTMRPYLYASNVGSWTHLLAYFLKTIVEEISRHLGRNLSHEVFDGEETGASISRFHIFEAPVHALTIRFLGGYLTSAMMECLYAKDRHMSSWANACLVNLCAIDPTLGQLIVPFLLCALDPAAVNQSHQAPIAMETLRGLIHPLLYPNPVLLRYLPDLLRLSLPGVDPNDARKSCVTLNMYVAILTWLPIKGAYDAPRTESWPPSVLSIVRKSHELDSEYVSRCAHIVDAENVQGNYNRLAPVIEDWALSLMDKIFELVEAQDEPKKGSEKTNTPAIVSYVGACVEQLFRACSLDTSKEFSLLTRLENKVLDYFRLNTPLQATKLSGLLLSAVSENNPSSIRRILDAILSPDVMNGTCGTEKLTFRLKLLAGAVRFSQSSILMHVERIRPLLGPQFTMHAEKSVREAALKLLKDFFRGVTGTYSLNGNSSSELEWPGFDEKSLLWGSPTKLSMDVHFHQPKSSDLSAVATILRETCVAALDETRAKLALFVTDLRMADETEENIAKNSLKSVEDRLQQLFDILRSCLRGVAEILGDAVDESGDAAYLAASARFTEIMGVVPFDVKEEAGCFDSIKYIDSFRTGRSHLLSDLSESDRKLFGGLRSSVMQILADYGTILTGSVLVGHSVEKLRSSTMFITSWLELFQVTFKLRMSYLKDIQNTKKWFANSLVSDRTVLSATIRRCLKNRIAASEIVIGNPHSALPQKWQSILTNADYYLGSTYSLRSLQWCGFIQYALRLQRYSFVSVKQCLWKEHPLSRLCSSVLYQLTQLCQHEYDAVRSEALKTFNSVYALFGKHGIGCIKALLQNIENPESIEPSRVFALAHGVYSLLQHRTTKIVRHLKLTEIFLNAVSSSHQVIVAVPDQAKRELLPAIVSKAFGEYAHKWVHIPFPNSDVSADTLLKMSLVNLGYNMDGTSYAAEAKAEGDIDGRGLRSESYAAFSILHMIGHDNIPMPSGVWFWALRTLANAHGQPTQIIALAALSRLCITTHGAKSRTHAPSTSVLRDIQRHLGTDGEISVWNSLLTGLSHAHEKGGEDEAQWSKGVDRILHGASALRYNLPRKEYVLTSDRNDFSGSLYKENIHLIFGLFAGHLVSLNEVSVGAIIEATNQLPSGSEAETRSSNATRAEVFGGILRATLLSENLHVDEGAAIVRRLIKMLQGFTAKLSLDFMSDWTEAVACGTQVRHPLASPIIEYILSDFRSLYTSAAKATDGDEGFSYEGRIIELVRALLVSDINSAVASRSSCVVAPLIVDIIVKAGASIVSSYRTSRLSIARLFASLVDVTHIDSVLSMLKATMHSASTVSDTEENPESSKAPALTSENPAKHALELLSIFVGILMQQCVKIDYVRILQPKLLALLLGGAGNAHIETAKVCHLGCLMLSQGTRVGLRTLNIDASNVLSESIQVYQEHAKHPSWHVRETVMLCLGAHMVNNWPSLTQDERKQCKDIFAEGFSDPKPEIQKLARVGLVCYLSNKSPEELQSFSEAFCRNSDKYVLLERKKRLENSGEAPTEKVDPKFANTVMMMSCIILAYPYDLPPFMPVLVSSLVRHSNTSSTMLKDTISRTILEFKRTHQDRWEEFKESFSRDQLDSLAGASQISYLS